MASLYELTTDVMKLQELLESGEIDDETFNDTIDSLDVEYKIENICKVIRNFEGQAKMFKEEKDRLAQKQKVAENAVKRLKESILTYLQATNTKKVESGIFKCSLGSSEGVNIIYEDLIPEEYLIPQPPKVDLAGIKSAIKNGEEIRGAELEKRPYVTIR